MKRTIPDLRDDVDQITLDHCYVLIGHLGKSFDQMEGTEDNYANILDYQMPDEIQEVLQKYFDAPAFSRLFKTDMGKGVLLGVYVKHILDEAEQLKKMREERGEG